VSQFSVGGTDYLWIKYYDGTQTTADSYLVAKFGGNPDRPYGSDRIGRGTQYVILTARYNTDLFSGMPTGIYEPRATPFYDPRLDSTNGGSGPHRWGDPSTYSPTHNPMVVAYNIARGIYYNGVWFYGGQNISAHRLPNAAWFAAANECDRNVNGAPQFRCGLEITLDTEPLDALEDLRVACAGRFAEVGGFIKPLVGAPGAAVYSFTDDGIVITKDQDFEPFPSLKSMHNRVTGTYPEPQEKWASKDAPENRNLALEAEDGNRSLPVSIVFRAVPFSAQVQTLVKIMVSEQRRFRVHVLTLPPVAAALQPNDVVSWTSSRNAYANKKFLVKAITGQTGMLRQVSLIEIDPTDYNPPDITVAPVIGWTGPITAPPQPMYGWQVLPAIIYDSNGNARRPAIKVITAPNQDDVRAVWVQVREKSTAQVQFDSNATAYAAPYEWIISSSLFLPATRYQARGRFLPYSNRQTEWSEWLDVQTDNIRYLPGLDYDPYNGVIGLNGLGDDVKGYLDWVGSGLRDIQTTQQELDARIADLDLASATVRDQLRQQIRATADQVTADYTHQVDVLAAADAAIVTSVTALTSTFNAQTASFTSQISTLAAADTAMTSRVDTLTARLNDPATGLQATATAVSNLQTTVTNLDGDVTAVASALTSLSAATSTGDVNSANFRMSVMSGPAGYSRIGAEARQGGAGNWRSAAWYLDVPNDAGLPTRFLVSADQFIVVAGGNLNNPFVIDGTAVRMNVANIGTVTAGVMQSANGKMVINLNAGTIVISS
jgi:hypothetical protein